jgi:4,5-dihydroxyphthalate decarboxylase
MKQALLGTGRCQSRRRFLKLAGAVGAATTISGAVLDPAARAETDGTARPSEQRKAADTGGENAAAEKLRIKFGCALYDRMIPLYSGEVEAEGIDLDFIPSEVPREIFDKMARGLEFDVAEFSSSEFITRMSFGKCPMVALPVFPARTFRHGYIAINQRSGIKTPKDLEGKRVGIQLYTMTADIFIRELLQHEYGVDLSKIHWVQGAIDKGGKYGDPDVMPLVKPVPIEINETGKSLSELLEAGSIDATIGSSLPPARNRNPDIQRLFPNFAELERDYYRRTRIFPIMHLIAIRRELYEQHPEIAPSLYKAFSLSKQRALERMRTTGTPRYMLPWMQADIDEIDELFGGDPWAYGVEANRLTLEALVTSLVEQGMISEPIPIQDLFVPV